MGFPFAPGDLALAPEVLAPLVPLVQLLLPVHLLAAAGGLAPAPTIDSELRLVLAQAVPVLDRVVPAQVGLAPAAVGLPFPVVEDFPK